MRGRRSETAAGPRRWRGELEGVPVVLAVCGEGPRAAGTAIEGLLRDYGPELVILVGVAGALSPELAAGAMCVGGELCSEQGERLAAGPSGAAALRRLPDAVEAVVLTVDRIVTGPEERRALWRRLGEPPVAVVDMESYAVVEAASRAGVETLVVRVVSDTAVERLPAWLNRVRLADGRISRTRAAFAALSHPRDLALLVRLRRRVTSASALLASALTRVIGAAR